MEQGATKRGNLSIQDSGESRILAEKFNLRLTEKDNRRVRLTVSTQNHQGAPVQKITQVLEALSTENSLAVSLGLSLSMYKDRFMFGVGRDVYDRRPKAVRKGTQDYIMTFKYWGLF